MASHPTVVSDACQLSSFMFWLVVEVEWGSSDIWSQILGGGGISEIWYFVVWNLWYLIFPWLLSLTLDFSGVWSLMFRGWNLWWAPDIRFLWGQISDFRFRSTPPPHTHTHLLIQVSLINVYNWHTIIIFYFVLFPHSIRLSDSPLLLK